MRGPTIPTSVSAALVLLFSLVNAEAQSPHASMARRHMYAHKRNEVVKRGTCEFPTDAGLVAVAPDKQNAGWAMSPDQPCKPGMYCPYACPPGQLMAQWDPSATTYSYPASMNGGLYCNKNGEIEKPFPNKPYCYDGTGSVSCKNKSGSQVAICQTVLPGNEAMLIPTVVTGSSVLAVPDTSYWAATAAHYYINPPGVTAEEGCVWGSKDKPVGNWSPYVAGANELDSGETFVKIGWNPIYIEPDVPFRNVVPDWGVRIDCDGGKCSGLPCYIDPAEHGVNEVSQMKGPGAGGANFCVVSVPKGAKAIITVFNKDGGETDTTTVKDKSSSSHPSPSPSPSPTSTESSSTSSTASATLTSTSSTCTSSTSTSSTSTSSTSTSSTSTSSTSKTPSKSPSSSPSPTASSSSEPSSFTDSPSSTVTDSPTLTGAGDEPTPTATSTGDYEESDQEEDSTSPDYNDSAELHAVNPTPSGLAPAPAKEAYAAAQSNDGVIYASPVASPTRQYSSSGVSISFSGASAMLLCSVFAALVIIL